MVNGLWNKLFILLAYHIINVLNIEQVLENIFKKSLIYKMRKTMILKNNAKNNLEEDDRYIIPQ